MDDIEDMGFLAEDACSQLAVEISGVHRGQTSHEELKQALRRFMYEAKKGQINGT